MCNIINQTYLKKKKKNENFEIQGCYNSVAMVTWKLMYTSQWLRVGEKTWELGCASGLNRVNGQTAV